MDFTDSQWIQLISGLALGVMLFVVAYAAPARFSIGLLLVLAPFQIIASHFGTLNIALIYVTGAAHIFRGRVRAFPLILCFAFIFFVYFLSMSQTPRATYLDHILYLVGVGANVVLFYVVYNYARQLSDVRVLLRFFVVMNALILVYCVIQLITGYERFAFLGVQEFEFAELNEAKQRLVGPFGTAGTNGELFVLQILLLSYLSLHQRAGTFRYIVIGMLLADLAFLLMTGSRGSFLTMIGSGVLFLWFFRHQLGGRRVLRIATIGLGAFALVAAIVLNFSQFNVLFKRLEATEVRGGIPDTRTKAFTYAFERIPEKPLLGHGPQLRLINEQERVIPGHTFLYFPHNLYLFLMVTIGFLGLVAYLLFFWAMYSWWRRARRSPRGDPFTDGLPTLAIVLLIAFLVDQLKIEFLRSEFSDLQQYLFALWAILLGATAPRQAPPPAPRPLGIPMPSAQKQLASP